MCHVTVGEKLGRPLALKLEDFDVELPRAINDDTPGEVFFDEFSKCSFRYGIYGFQVTALHMQIYSNLYAVRPTMMQPYEQNVRKLGKELEDWHSSLPTELLHAPSESPHRVAGLYMDLSLRHLQLMLHHPALCKAPNQEFTIKNLDICLEASSRMLAIAVDLQKLKSLDTTWFYTAIFLAAIFTTLFAFLERKDHITSAELAKTKSDMDKWGEVMGDIGTLLGKICQYVLRMIALLTTSGSGQHLQVALGKITDSVIETMGKHLAARTASAAVASAGMNRSSGGLQIEQQSEQAMYPSSTVFINQYPSQSNPAGQDASASTMYLPPQDQSIPQQPFPTTSAFVYPEPAHQALPAYAQAPMSFNSSYNEDIKPDMSAQLSDAHSQTPYFYPANTQPSSVAWRQFADNMMTSMTPHWSANALMALQGQSQSSTPVKHGISSSNPEDRTSSPAVVGAEMNGVADTSSDAANGPQQGMALEHNHVHNMSHGHNGHVHGGVGFDLNTHPQHWPMMYNG